MPSHGAVEQQVVSSNSGFTVTYVCACGNKSVGASNANQTTAVANAKSIINSHLTLNGVPILK